MRKSILAVMWALAIALLVALPVGPVLADPPVAQKVVDHPTNIKPVPRGMPDLVPYWNFDPPKSPLFDLKNLTISGDLRVRPEFRTNSNFGVGLGSGGGTQAGSNDWYVQQWARIGINYAISPDVDFFVQPQWAKNWGAAANNTTGASGAGGSPAGCGGGNSICANDAFNNGQADSLFMRQAFMMIRNVGVEGLSIKAGRQLVVMGDHRLFGHFDWANTGFSHDGITLQYNQPKFEIWGGWLRTMETDFNGFGAQSTSFGVMPQGCNTNTSANGTTGFSCNNKAGQDSDLFFARLALKPMAGLSIEPLWVWQRNSATATTTAGGAAPQGLLSAHANGQSRHTLGLRAALRQGIFDGSAEWYTQQGTMDIGGTGQRAHINAQAIAVEGGVTLAQVPWSPRIGLEFNYASGDGNGMNCDSANTANCRGNANTFENLYPTNHIVMGYADMMAWRNMVAYSASFQVIPFNNAANHLEFRYWNFRKANTGDCWYRAAQNCYATGSSVTNGNTSAHLYDEIDFIYTLFFANNKVAWQTGFSYLFAGSYLDRQAQIGSGSGAEAVNQTWGYTQLHVNF